MDWDDLQHFLAVSRTGSLSGAARVLRVNHATVLRRIRSLEEVLEARLFDRLPNGYALTATGEEMLPHAERIEQEILTVDRRIAGRDIGVSGAVRVTTVDTFADLIVGPSLGKLASAFPGLSLELATYDRWANLSRREADIALRPSNAPGDTMVGRKLAVLRFALYEAATCPSRPAPEQWEGERVVVGDDVLQSLTSDRWFRQQTASATIAVKATSYLTQAAVCASGAGIACLPCYVGDGNRDLQRLDGPIEGLATDVWLLTHPDIRTLPRIRAAMDWLAETVLNRRKLIEGG
ncbi:MAG: LysR family transcriptional regulator [Alphaproteobacteria bacterium]